MDALSFKANGLPPIPAEVEPAGRALRALLIDASESRRDSLRQALERELSVTLEEAHGFDELMDALRRRRWDVVLYSGEGRDAVPTRKARAVARLADPHLLFIVVSPGARPDDLIGLVRGTGSGAPVIADPSRVAAAVREHQEQARRDKGRRLLAAQQEVTEHIAGALEPPALLERVAASLTEALGFEHSLVWRAGSGEIVPGRGLEGRVLASRFPEWTDEGVAFPVVEGNRVEAVIALYSRHVQEADAEVAALLAGIGSQLGRYLSSRRGGERDALRYLDVTGTMIVVLDARGRVRRLNRRAARTLGCHEDELAGRDWFGLTAPEDAREPRRRLLQRLMRGEVSEDELAGEEATLLTLSGDQRTVVWHSTVLRGDDDEVLGTLHSGDDVTSARQAEQQVTYLAYHDPLTGLPNRSLLEEHLKLALARTRRNGTSLALLHLDIDNFKLVNDSLGHGAGDELLSILAVRLQQLVRATDLLARVGGDEFLLLLADLDDPLVVAERVATQIMEAIVEPFRIGDEEFQVSASIGVCTSPRDGHDHETLLANADAAMYQAKQVARGGWASFSAGEEDPLARLSMTARLRRALREDEFTLHYQPIFDLATQALVGVEALLRWDDPHHGPISPADFIPVAEENGLIETLGDWVVRAVCEQQVTWAARGLLPQISFNVSPQQLKRLDFADCVAAHVRETGADPARLTVELTESSTLQDHVLTAPILQRLDDMGMNIALDDFGSGYSSLSRLRELPVETLKIDRAFLSEVPHSQEAAAIVTAILRLSRALGRTAVAEGVETEEQRAFLVSERCQLAQGFLFGRPVPPEDLEVVLARSSPAA